MIDSAGLFPVEHRPDLHLLLGVLIALLVGSAIVVRLLVAAGAALSRAGRRPRRGARERAPPSHEPA